ncbi:GNAT family N-acetyltransferase [Anabaena subtropica]|uniref:GNAT family N-acetyltransferase n=1 Tax=Anabaena subtropica FACHB-260 TaxID=2692884 RepID=A0ABR8CKI3_9NOST|nr:GNAT family N-acetyltransferase [Anabaena subtropica]MBD2343660.1 GNAT family N-acetyltransferase [Anabaena subtropica FACHB-260]
MKLTFKTLQKDHALAILKWRYTYPYDCYNFDANTVLEDLCYLLDPKNAFHAILNPLGQLEGYCSFGADGQVLGGNYGVEALDLGMAIRPDLTGQRHGEQYAKAVMKYGAARYGAQFLRVTVAQFNKRGQRVWEKLGFEQIEEFTKIGSGEKFVIMTRAV